LKAYTFSNSSRTPGLFEKASKACDSQAIGKYFMLDDKKERAKRSFFFVISIL